MWNNWIEKGRTLAEKANKAAAELEAQLNDSVGIQGESSTTTTTNTTDVGAIHDVNNDDFFHHDDDDVNLTTSRSAAAVIAADVDYGGGDWADTGDDDVNVDSDGDGDGDEVVDLQSPIDQQRQQKEEPSLVAEQGMATVVAAIPEVTTNDAVVAEEGTYVDGMGGDDDDEMVEVNDGWAEDDVEVKFSQEEEDNGNNDAVATEGHLFDDEEEEYPNSKDEEVVNMIEEKTMTNDPPPTADVNGSLSAEVESQKTIISLLQSELTTLQNQLSQREQQLASKSAMITSLQEIHQSETDELQNKIRETKDEAKKRVLRANEKLEDYMKQLEKSRQQMQEQQQSSTEDKDSIIEQLREEGTKLAMKQGQIEQQFKLARREVKDLNERLVEETDAREKAAAAERRTKEQLDEVKKTLTESQKKSDALSTTETTLRRTREDVEKHKALNLTLENTVAELNKSLGALKSEMTLKDKEGLEHTVRESEKIKKERDEMLDDLQKKWRVSEREANRREDSLRHEVQEVRKRWQDAVRRADALSMDVQNSTAPLMRQLESTERQNRVRATAWAEMESKLRSDLENAILSNDTLVKEKHEQHTVISRLERSNNEMKDELRTLKDKNEELTYQNEKLTRQMDELRREGNRIKEEWVEVERLAKANKVRSDMMKSVMDSEERYRSQLELLEQDLEVEKSKRVALEEKLESLVESSAMMLDNAVHNHSTKKEKPKKLTSGVDQVSILQDALIDSDDDDDDDEDNNPFNSTSASGPNSFAAMEQLSQWLKGSELELEALRKQLSASEETRDALVNDVTQYRQAAERLPLFESKVKELTAELREKELEIEGLHDDIIEIKMMYRTQLDMLLEEKAAAAASNDQVEVEGDSNDNDGGGSEGHIGEKEENVSVTPNGGGGGG